ncbi:hypothetical protein PGTDC60_0095 [Porphyromonas gingivalis TDC60]|nr:hypothetical protein PGTDC60_0095 [Porphyromonas gingivalis TDC60]
MVTKQIEQAPSFLQVYAEERLKHMKPSFLRPINLGVEVRGEALQTMKSPNLSSGSSETKDPNTSKVPP